MIAQSYIVPFHYAHILPYFEEKFMTIYEHARNVFAVIGLLAMSGLIGLVGWHAVAAVRRFRASRDARANERAKALVQAEPASKDPYGDEPLGI